MQDQAAGLLSLEATLEPLQQRLHRAQSGREALRLVSELNPDLALSDLEMPVMAGVELIRSLSADRDAPHAASPSDRADPHAASRSSSCSWAWRPACW